MSAWTSGTLDCGGATFTPSGSPTAGVASYWRPAGGAAGTGVGFDGVDDFMDGGNVAAPTGSFTVLANINLQSSTAGYIIGKDGGVAGGRSWLVYKGTGTVLSFYVHASDASSSVIASAAVPFNTDLAVCLSYEYVTSGTSIMRANIGGIVPTEITNAVGPAQQTATPLRIGASGAATPANYFSGSASKFRVIPRAFSAAECAAAVRSQYAAQGSLGEAITVSGPATSAVLTKADGSPYVATVPANMPSIVAGGVQVYGAYYQYVLYPNDLSQTAWSKETGVTYETASSSCPVGPDGTRMTLVSISSNERGIYQSWTHTAAAHTVSAWLARATADADCTTDLRFAYQPTIGSKTVALTATPTRHFVTATTAAGTAGIYLSRQSTSTCSRFCMWGANESNTATLVPYAATAASPLSVAATSVSAGHGIADPNRWCVSFKGIPSGGWQSGIARYLFSIGTGANRVEAFTNVANNLYFSVYDATNTGRTVYRQAPTGTPEIDFCVSGGALSISYDNVVQAVNATGAGTGVIGTLAASASVGSTAVGTSQFDGSISAVTTCNTPFAGECQ